MRRTLLALALLLLAACSGDGDDVSGWLDQWDLEHVETIDGHEVGIDEAKRTIYVEDCDTARKLTSEGERFGPTTEPGYAYICP